MKITGTAEIWARALLSAQCVPDHCASRIFVCKYADLSEYVPVNR